MDTPFEDLPQEQQDIVLYGAKDKTFHFRYENDFGGIRDIDTTFEGSFQTLIGVIMRLIAILPAM